MDKKWVLISQETGSAWNAREGWVDPCSDLDEDGEGDGITVFSTDEVLALVDDDEAASTGPSVNWHAVRLQRTCAGPALVVEAEESVIAAVSDRGLTPAQLEAKYESAGEHPWLTRQEWREDVASGNLSDGYWTSVHGWLQERASEALREAAEAIHQARQQRAFPTPEG